jgi:hypothetical protein
VLDIKNPNLLVLFVRNDCEFCHQALDLIKDIEGPIFAVYMVFPSRVEGMAEIRPMDKRVEGLPLLVSEDQIPTVPLLYDPTIGESVAGIEEIERYFEDSGLIASS